MKRGIARITDACEGHCNHPSHNNRPIVMTGTITTGITNSVCNGLAMARAGDICTGTCGHTGIIVDSGVKFSITSRAGGGTRSLARTGDEFIGDFYGVITGGSINGVVGDVS